MRLCSLLCAYCDDHSFDCIQLPTRFSAMRMQFVGEAPRGILCFSEAITRQVGDPLHVFLFLRSSSRFVFFAFFSAAQLDIAPRLRRSSRWRTPAPASLFLHIAQHEHHMRVACAENVLRPPPIRAPFLTRPTMPAPQELVNSGEPSIPCLPPSHGACLYSHHAHARLKE